MFVDEHWLWRLDLRHHIGWRGIEARSRRSARRRATCSYEFWYAKEHLHKAMEEAATADYGDAIKFAGIAEEKAERAIMLSKQAHEGSGR